MSWQTYGCALVLALRQENAVLCPQLTTMATELVRLASLSEQIEQYVCITLQYWSWV